MFTQFTVVFPYLLPRRSDCLELSKFYDSFLLNMVNNLSEEKISAPDKLPLLFKSLRDKGIIPDFHYRRIVGLLLEIDGIIEMRINGDMSDEKCKKEIEKKYQEAISLLTTINTNWDFQLNLNPASNQGMSWEEPSKSVLTV